ncbi:MAG: hypothetical protein MHMPM18_004111 [Marteilia pararefringens]
MENPSDGSKAQEVASLSAANPKCDLRQKELAERSRETSNQQSGVTNLKERSKSTESAEYSNRDAREQEYIVDQISKLENLSPDDNKRLLGRAMSDESELVEQKDTSVTQDSRDDKDCEDDDLNSRLDKQQQAGDAQGPCPSCEVLKSTTLRAGGKKDAPKNSSEQQLAAARSTVENYVSDLKRSYLFYYAGDQQLRSNSWKNPHLTASRSTAAAAAPAPCNAWNLLCNEDIEVEEHPKTVRYLSNTLLVNYKQRFKQANKESHEFVNRMNHEISEEHAGRLVTRSDNFEFDLEKPVNVNGVSLDTFCSSVRYVASGAYGNIFAVIVRPSTLFAKNGVTRAALFDLTSTYCQYFHHPSH